MRVPAIVITVLFLAGLPAVSQAPADDIPYEIKFDPEKDVTLLDRYDGKDALFIKVKFTVEVKGNAKDYRNYKIHIFEDGKEVAVVDLPAPKPSKGLSVILAVDTSAKIEENWQQVLKAADVFFKAMPKEAECGLILFNDQIRQTIELSLDRGPVVSAIQTVKPAGGNACLNATLKAIDMLENVPANKAKAVVLISNGLDQYSPKDAKKKIIAAAAKNQVLVHTIGIGEATRPQNVNIVLVLDKSGSMDAPADDVDPTPKIKGLHKAATAFIERIPPATKTTLIPFSSAVDVAKPFRTGEADDKADLIGEIKMLKSEGETALFDAVFSALATLEAENAPGKRAVLAMTDGIDNISRRRAAEVIERAKDAGIPLFMLGFGRDDKDHQELDAKTMTMMAEQTGGKYFHAANQKALLDYFEHLAIKINEQGIDADTLREIAYRTSGTYNHARDVKSLPLILKEVHQVLTNREEERIFKAGRQVRDAVSRKITLKLVRTLTKVTVPNAAALHLTPGKSVIEVEGEKMLVTAVDLASNVLTVVRDYDAAVQNVTHVGAGKVSTTSQDVSNQSASIDVKGVVVAQMDHVVYLALLGALGVLILLPAFFRKA